MDYTCIQITKTGPIILCISNYFTRHLKNGKVTVRYSDVSVIQTSTQFSNLHTPVATCKMLKSKCKL